MKHSRIILGLMVAVCAVVLLCAFTPSASKRIDKQVERILQEMTTREKIAQLIFSQTDSYLFSEKHKEKTNQLVEVEGIGGLLILQDSLPRYLTRMNELQSKSKIPMLVSIDGEWGPSMRFVEFPFFPQQMQLGALPNDSLIYEMGLAVAEQCKLANIHINFAPVVDINVNPKNPVIHARSFGENREKVTTYARAYMRGMQNGGIIACAKHFPGHGDTEVDSHKGLPVLTFDKEHLEQLELYPFADQIQQGVKMVMIGHLLVPALDTTVSSISQPIITGLLKQEMGFEGIVVTDALSMKAVSATRTSAEIAIAAYKAGVDILLQPRDIKAAIDRLEEAMTTGECSIEELDDRVRKILRVKAELGMLDRKYSAIVDTTGISQRAKNPAHIALIQQMADESITLVKNEAELLPLDLNKKIAYIAYNAKHMAMQREFGDLEGIAGYNPATGMVDSTTLMYQHLLKACAMQNKTQNLVHYYSLDKTSSQTQINALCEHLDQYDVVILACHDPRGRIKRNLLSDEHIAGMSELVKKYHPILVHFGSPYGLSQLTWLDDTGAIVVSYQDSESNQRATAKILTGEIKAVGQLPVSY